MAKEFVNFAVITDFDCEWSFFCLHPSALIILIHILFLLILKGEQFFEGISLLSFSSFFGFLVENAFWSLGPLSPFLDLGLLALHAIIFNTDNNLLLKILISFINRIKSWKILLVCSVQRELLFVRAYKINR